MNAEVLLRRYIISFIGWFSEFNADMSDVQDSRPAWHPPPSFHLKAPQGWMNDPCAPGFDSATGTYHLFYQCKPNPCLASHRLPHRPCESGVLLNMTGNPKSCSWGHICWGHFTSQDGLRWEHNGDEPVIRPTVPYDKAGIFTGCFYPTGPRGEDGQLSIFYSPITHLPIHWTLPYVRDCAGLAMAVSDDKGRTWRKHEANPILKGEPDGLSVTGFRDPYIAEWPAMDKLRGEKSLYGIISGGVVDKGPNAFVYSVSPLDLTTWSYLGPLVDVPVQQRQPEHWCGSLGLNWECVNFLTLGHHSQDYEFLIMGTEGGLKQSRDKVGGDSQVVSSLWLAGSLQQTDEGVRLKHEFAGILDNGTFYAANSYQHPITKSRIVWGWIKEEELTEERRESKGWAGYLAMPRELFLLSVENVVGTLRTPLEEISSIKIVGNDANGATIHTLGMRPLPAMSTLRPAAHTAWSRVGGSLGSGKLRSTLTAHWELEASIRVQASYRRIGFHICENEDSSQRTTIYFSPGKEEIVVDRSRSNSEADICKDELAGPFSLFHLGTNGLPMLEALALRIFIDGDVLEVFANDRFALSATVYADTQACSDVSWFIEGDVITPGAFETIKIWDGIAPVQLSRSEN